MTDRVMARSPAQPGAWEAAYLRFETRSEEVRKFERRLRGLGVHRWHKDMDVVELFCGRGSGLLAFERLGFHRLSGADLSHALVGEYAGQARLVVCDCRKLPFAAATQDVAVIQGGLHHLLDLRRDLEATLGEVHRVLREGGRLVVVEPWRTPFLDVVHVLSGSPLVRRLSGKMDAFATMVEHERETYEAWLSQPDTILSLLRRAFQIEVCRVRWGKLSVVARKAPHVPSHRAPESSLAHA
jgi:ubiquinone/menaquinone biosynthesis C-methylase UbiE